MAVAKEHRSEGKEKAEIIRANIDAKVTVMLADAERNSRQLRIEGDALAAKRMRMRIPKTRVFRFYAVWTRTWRALIVKAT